MHKLISTTTIAVKPSPTPVGTPGYCTPGDLGLGVARTQLNADWFNTVTDELLNIAGELEEPESTDATQCVRAIKNIRPSNLIVNGDFAIWQRGQAGWVACAHQQYLADRWVFLNETLAVATIAADYDVPSHTVSGTSLPFSLSAVTTATSTPSSTHGCSITQFVEGRVYGQNIRSQLTYSFWTKASRTGKFPIAFQNADKSQSYVTTFQISAIDTWQRVSVTIDRPTTGSWLTGSETGISVSHVLSAGTGRQTTEGSWVAGDYISTSTCNSFTDTTAWVKITGCQLETGSIASAFIATDPTLELLKCMRYYQTNFYHGAQDFGQFITSDVTAGRTYRRGYQFMVPMRFDPTITLQNVNDQAFPPVSGLVIASNPLGFIESRVADTTSEGGFYSKFTADAELLYV